MGRKYFNRSSAAFGQDWLNILNRCVCYSKLITIFLISWRLWRKKQNLPLIIKRDIIAPKNLMLSLKTKMVLASIRHLDVKWHKDKNNLTPENILPALCSMVQDLFPKSIGTLWFMAGPNLSLSLTDPITHWYQKQPGMEK